MADHAAVRVAGGDGAASVTSSVANRAELDAVVRAVLAVSSGLDLTATLQQIVDAAAGLVDARYAALAVLGRAWRVDRFVYVGIDETTAALIGRPPCGRGVLGAIIRRGQPLRLDDVTAHPAFTGFPAHHPPMSSFLGVPILVRGRAFGRLYVDREERRARFHRGRPDPGACVGRGGRCRGGQRPTVRARGTPTKLATS